VHIVAPFGMDYAQYYSAWAGSNPLKHDKPLWGWRKSMNYESEFIMLIEKVTSAIEKPINRNDYKIIDRGVPHTPPIHLPNGKAAVYTFIHHGRFLKIGKANRKSSARFSYQHYSPKSASSTLASSILHDKSFVNQNISEDDIGTWIKQNCRRVDILMNEALGVFALDLIESILHYRYEPKYEGLKSQRVVSPH